MKILGSGIDIVEIQRIKDIVNKNEIRFTEKILHAKEIAELANEKNTMSFIAKRFAVKEAAAKALGTGIGKQLGFTDMYVEHDHLGKPILKFTDECITKLHLENTCALLTIADEQSYAVAHVLLYTDS